MDDLKRKAALLGSVKKWEEICSSDLILDHAHTRCSLCRYSDDMRMGSSKSKCLNCPLKQYGFWCFKENSEWRRINEIISWFDFGDKTLAQAQNGELTHLCEKQLQIIKNICKKEGIEIEEDGV